MFNLGDRVKFQILHTYLRRPILRWRTGTIMSVRSAKKHDKWPVKKDFLVYTDNDVSYWISERELRFEDQPLDKSESDTTIYENLPPPMGQEDMGR